MWYNRKYKVKGEKLRVKSEKTGGDGTIVRLGN